jgi:hypothetical protein
VGKALDDAANQAAAAFSFLSRWASDEPVADILSGEPAPPARAPSSPPPAPRASLSSLDCHVCGVVHLDECRPRDVAAHARARAREDARTIVVEAERVEYVAPVAAAAPASPPASHAAPAATVAPGGCTFCGGGGTAPIQGADHRWRLVPCPECTKR